ncbi:MAG: GIY-YIG nuclease family protein [Proteobacteria bacterium]|nr:GIY-YIG nuclease family protein [Pseudomonadota bacterium]
MIGRSIRIFLVDGTSTGVRTAELGLSTIKALAVPRASLSAVTDRPEVSKTGAYVLIGDDSESPGRKKIYIGEGDTILTRLSAHNKAEDKDFWDECVLFVSKDQNLNKAHARYLEARLIKLASDAKRATLTNGTAPTVNGWLSEPDEVEMEEFISQARLLLGSLGYDIFESQSVSPPSLTSTNPIAPPPTSPSVPDFQYNGDGFAATCLIDSDAGQFIVRSGSLARKHETISLQPTYKSLRKQLLDIGVLVEHNDDSFRFSQDYAFGAPSAAAQVVSGSTVNGRAVWKTITGQTLAEWQDARLPSVPSA